MNPDPDQLPRSPAQPYGWITSLSGATLVYGFLLLLFFYPYINDISWKIIGSPQDAYQDFWNTWYTNNQLSTDPAGFFFTNLLRFPDGVSLLHHSFSYPSVIFVFLIIKLTPLSADLQTLLTLHNSMLLVSYLLAAMGMYLLCRKLTEDKLAGLIAGFLFAFSPIHHVHFLTHMHVASLQYLPFFLFFFVGYVEKRTLPGLLLSTIFCLLGTLSSWYFLIYNLLLLGLYVLWHAVRNRQLFPVEVILPGLYVALGVLLVISPMVIAMALETSEFPNVYAEANPFSRIDLAALIQLYPYHLLNPILENYDLSLKGNFTEKTGYLGIVSLVILTWYLVKNTDCQKQAISLAFWGMGFFLFWAIGQWLYIGGTKFPIPGAHFFSQHLPLIKNLRVPSRAMVYVMLFYSLLAGIAISYLLRTKTNKILVSAVLILLLLDFYPAQIVQSEIVLPPAYSEIPQNPDEEYGVMDLPDGYIQGNRYMMFQVMHGKKILSGSTSRWLQKSLMDKMEWKNLAEQKAQLIAHKAKYIVIHKSKRQLLKKIMSKYNVGVQDYRNTYKVLYEDQEQLLLEVY